MKRKQLSEKKRFEIFKRDFFTCQYCGATPPSVVLHVDHIHPVADGGGNEEHNLVTACEACNLGKSSNPLFDRPKSLADRAEEIKEREAQMLGYNKVLEERATRIERDAWEVAEEIECC